MYDHYERIIKNNNAKDDKHIISKHINNKHKNLKKYVHECNSSISVYNENYEKLLTMALDFHYILDKYNIWYVGIGGTLLGAVRHHGKKLTNYEFYYLLN